MTDQEIFLRKKGRIKCKKLDCNMSIDQCVKNQRKKLKRMCTYDGILDRTIEKCRNCKQGAKYYAGPVIKKETKECKMHKLFPDRCKGTGIITKDPRINNYTYDRKDFCCDECSKLSTYLFFKDHTALNVIDGMRVA